MNKLSLTLPLLPAFFAVAILNFPLAQASVSCSGAHSEAKSTLSELQPLLSAPLDPAIPQETLTSLAENLYTFNPDFHGRSFVQILEVKAIEVEKKAEHPRYPYYVARIVGKALFRKTVEANGKLISEKLIEVKIDERIPFRTNGKAAFIASTWQMEQLKHRKLKFNVAIQKPHKANEIISISQDALVLNSLPENVILSRSMSEKEKDLWTSGEIDQIRSEVKVFGSVSVTEPKTTFALNNFEFMGMKPMKYTIPKSVLLGLEKLGLISVNVYEDAANTNGKAMPPEARTPFGLEVEIVVHGMEGRKAILPWMQKPIQ